jgi:hypothetical protein
MRFYWVKDRVQKGEFLSYCDADSANYTIKQRRFKTIGMRFYWIKDRVQKGEFLIYWACGKDNLADNYTKHHFPAHHRLMRSR